MSFVTRKQQPLDTATRMRLIKRNISNALYSNGRIPKGGFGTSQDVSNALFSKGLDTYLNPNSGRVCDDPSIVYGSLSFLLDKPEPLIFIISGSFPLNSGSSVSGLAFYFPDKFFFYATSTAFGITGINASFSAAGGYNIYYSTGTEGILFIEGQKSKECLLKAIPELMSSPWRERRFN